MKLLAAAAITAAVGGTAAAAEQPVPIKDAPGRDVVEANCSACHSLDYIRTNAPYMTAKVWEAEVAKMINAFGAPIEPADAKTIIDYLAHQYGIPG